MGLHLKSLLITGGAGFVGSNLAVLFRRAMPDLTITVCDNLMRRGSEMTLPRLREHGITFLHSDIRCPEDTDAWPAFDLCIDCAAEPSVHAGAESSPAPLLGHNLTGAIHCLEAARKRDAAFLFLSTSRVIPIDPLNQLAFTETDARYALAGGDGIPGCSPEGIAEDFPLHGARSMYGASKLSVELLLQEYAAMYRMPVMINRCGILCGPWQMGKVDQGVITLWVARHHFNRPLQYTGFGGTGKQVRDALHVEDLFDLICKQLQQPETWTASPYHVGGGREISTSLRELTALCQSATGTTVEIGQHPKTSPLDIRIYLSDARRAQSTFDWRPTRSMPIIIEDIARWIAENETALASVLA